VAQSCSPSLDAIFTLPMPACACDTFKMAGNPLSYMGMRMQWL
jgi:hypothetical protein